MMPKALGGAVVLAAVSQEPQQADEHYRAFLQHGMQFANIELASLNR